MGGRRSNYGTIPTNEEDSSDAACRSRLCGWMLSTETKHGRTSSPQRRVALGKSLKQRKRKPLKCRERGVQKKREQKNDCYLEIGRKMKLYLLSSDQRENAPAVDGQP